MIMANRHRGMARQLRNVTFALVDHGVGHDHGSTAPGGRDAKSEALLLPGYQPPPALFTPAVSTKPHKTGDSAGARREKLASKIIGAAAPDHDHGGTVVGGCDAKSETAPRGDLDVVVGPSTTQERRDGTNDDKRSPGRASRQAHVAQKSQRSQPGAREAPDDHGSTSGGTARFP